MTTANDIARQAEPPRGLVWIGPFPDATIARFHLDTVLGATWLTIRRHADIFTITTDEGASK